MQKGCCHYNFSIISVYLIQDFSVKTVGALDLDSELELWFSGLGKVKKKFVSKADVPGICKYISEYVLK